MGIFNDVTLEWDGKTYTVPSNRVMRAIAVVEDYVTLKELSEYAQDTGSAKFAKLMMAYAALLQFAGAKVQDDEIYFKMLKEVRRATTAEEAAVTQVIIVSAINGLLGLMLPPQVLVDEEMPKEGDSAPGKTAPTAEQSSP